MSENSEHGGERPNAGRPSYYDEPMESASLRLPADMKDLLRRAGGPGGMSRAIRVLVDAHRDDLQTAAESEDGL